MRNFFQAQTEFSVQSTTKKFIKDNHYNTIHGQVRSECSPCRVVYINSECCSSRCACYPCVYRSWTCKKFMSFRNSEEFAQVCGKINFLQILGTFVAYVILSVQFADGDADCRCGTVRTTSDSGWNSTSASSLI